MNQKDKQVLEYIDMKKMVSTTELCEIFGYSESTARRVLQRLVDSGLVERYHGGAISNQDIKRKTGIQERLEYHFAEKDNIAKCAAEQIKQGSTVVLLGGSTVYKMCKYLIKKNITVITNSMIVFDELKDRDNIVLILLGGRYNFEEMEVRGALTYSGLQILRADKVFMGATKFHPQIGFMTSDLESVELYRLCIEAAKETYILADSSKLGKDGTAVMASCTMVDYLITDKKMGSEEEKEFAEKGVKVLRV